jgi:methylphosphotriester-DNA--protein-cysteine methyltransferase
MSQENPDLLAVSKALNQAAEAIEARKEATEDGAEFDALNAQLRQIDRRLQKVNGLLFVQRSQAITQAARQVGKAQADLTSAIRDVQKLNTVIASVTGFVGLVDRVIAVASSKAI